MFPLDWQTSIALLCVAGAVTVLARRLVFLVRSPNGSAGACGGGSCSNCPSQTDPAARTLPLVTLDAEPDR